MQTVSRETAEKLKAAGWVKETTFSWILDEDGSWQLVYYSYEVKEIRPECWNDWLPAPTPDEILDDLPRWTALYKSIDGYWADVHGTTIIESELHHEAAEALADVWLKTRKP